MSLRSRLIEAAASAIAGDRGEGTGDIGEEFFWDAEVALDAFLDVLEVDAEEWGGSAHADMVDGLVNAVRDGEDE